MIITVTNVGKVQYSAKGKTTWSSYPVEYSGDKGDKTKKFMSFNVDEYKLGKTLEEGKTYAVTLEKDGDYWIWTGVEETEAEQAPARAAPAARGGAAGNTWDLKNQLDRERFEFDKEKQILIIRQSMVAAAVEFVTSRGDWGVDDVLSIADDLVAYVLNGPADVVEDEQPEQEAAKPRGRPRKEVDVE